MRREPLEISIVDPARLRNRRQRQRAVSINSTHVHDFVLSQDVVDEAFADLPATCEPVAAGPQVLISQLAAQVGAIDRHCQRLSQVIKNLDAQASSSQ